MKKGYKGFDKDLKCRDFQYEVGKTYECEKAEVCSTGFHYCKYIKDVLDYYPITSRFCEIEDLGKTVTEQNKSATTKIKIVKELTRGELIKLFKCKDNNLGKNNLGDTNTGNCNTGNRNTGDTNTGNWNTGDTNTGNTNTGNCNTGYRNTGNRNTGNWNTGDTNTGNCNTGYRNTGNWNTGNWNTGDTNTGNTNTGNCNTGYRNTGNCNTGDTNTGNRNTGDTNTGNWNTGDSNTGDSNTGNWNKCNNETGFFNSKENKYCNVFNKKCLRSKFTEAKKPDFLYNVRPNIWVSWDDMNDEEKKTHPNSYTQNGYLKSISMNEAWENAFNQATNEDIKLLKALPNYDYNVFSEITGLTDERLK